LIRVDARQAGGYYARSQAKMAQPLVKECASSADSALALLVDRMRVAREAVAVARIRATARGSAENVRAVDELQRVHDLLERAVGMHWRSRARLGGYRVMLVHSDSRARRHHGDALEGVGAEVARIASAEEALERVTWCRPDVVVSALDMPGTDGCEFLRRLRARPADRGGNIAAVALIASTHIEDGRRALLAGYSFHVRTPADATTLARAVAKAFDCMITGR
jgi:CheY-like chemotaxis protein